MCGARKLLLGVKNGRKCVFFVENTRRQSKRVTGNENARLDAKITVWGVRAGDKGRKPSETGASSCKRVQMARCGSKTVAGT